VKKPNVAMFFSIRTKSGSINAVSVSVSVAVAVISRRVVSDDDASEGESVDEDATLGAGVAAEIEVVAFSLRFGLAIWRALSLSSFSVPLPACTRRLAIRSCNGEKDSSISENF
jgi:hypothetical protein